MGDLIDPIAALDALVPTPIVARIGLRDVQIKPLTVRQLAPFGRALKDIPDDVLAGIISGQIDIVGVMAHSDAIARALAAATDAPLDALLDSDVVEFMDLAQRVIEVNADFFGRRLKAAAGSQTPGPMSSSD